MTRAGPANHHRSVPSRSPTGPGERGGIASSDPRNTGTTLAADGYADDIELADYGRTLTRKDADDREARRQEKRAQKRVWLETQDEMKFSHSIQFNAVPDWSSHYIAYSNLKKL